MLQSRSPTFSPNRAHIAFLVEHVQEALAMLLH